MLFTVLSPTLTWSNKLALLWKALTAAIISSKVATLSLHAITKLFFLVKGDLTEANIVSRDSFWETRGASPRHALILSRCPWQRRSWHSSSLFWKWCLLILIYRRLLNCFSWKRIFLSSTFILSSSFYCLTLHSSFCLFIFNSSSEIYAEAAGLHLIRTHVQPGLWSEVKCIYV